MRIAISFMLLALIAFSFSFSVTSCSSSPAPFCDTTCNNDTIRFTIDHPDEPFVAIGMKNCKPDTITWSHDGLSAKRKFEFTTLTGKEVHINKNYMRSFIKDTSYIWLTFNDCTTGQGFVAKIPFDKAGNIVRKNSAFNSFDPRFVIAENLVAYTDKGNIFVEDMTTGKKATMTFGKMIENMDYNNIHDTVDSVYVSADRVRARVKIENEWQAIEKKITLQ